MQLKQTVFFLLLTAILRRFNDCLLFCLSYLDWKLLKVGRDFLGGEVLLFRQGVCTADFPAALQLNMIPPDKITTL